MEQNQIHQQQPIDVSRIRNILIDAGEQVGATLVCGMAQFSCRKEGVGWTTEVKFSAMFPEEGMIGYSEDSFPAAAEQAVANYREGERKTAAREAVCQECKASDYAHVARGGNNRRLTDALGETFNLCGYKCLYPWRTEKTEGGVV